MASERKGVRAIKHHSEMKIFKNWKIVAYSPDLLAEAHEMNKDYDMQLETSEEWDGEGLPPIGLECEYRINAGDWLKGELHAERGGYAWVSGKTLAHRVHAVRNIEFRKIETEEDERVTELAKQLCADMGTLIEMTPWKRLPLAKQNQYRDLIEMGWSKS